MDHAGASSGSTRKDDGPWGVPDLKVLFFENTTKPSFDSPGTARSSPSLEEPLQWVTGLGVSSTHVRSQHDSMSVKVLACATSIPSEERING